jgi:flagellar hook-associated protein 3 FlgL
MPNNDIQYYLRRQEEALSNQQSRIAGNSRIRELRDDPLAVSHAVRYESYLARLERYEKNTLFARDHYNEVDVYLRQTNDVLQRIRELAVAGANGSYAPEDLKYMAVEINELLKAIVAASNAIGPDTKQLFAGEKVFTEPFRLVEGTVQGGGESMVVRVEYRGAGPARDTEISENTYASLDIGGGEAFWAEKMQVFSALDATNYRVPAEGVFYVDGEEIVVNSGDTLHAIVAKINESAAPVKAYVDPETKGIALEGTNAHLIRLEDRQDSGVLQDLGLIVPNNDPAAPNWHPEARVAGGSIFDMVIRLRDALYRGDQDFVGSQGIGGIDLALNNLAGRIADIGSRQERTEMTWRRINDEIPNVTAALDREIGLDLTTAATDLNMMDLARRATLQTAARIIPPTLLDFLR